MSQIDSQRADEFRAHTAYFLKEVNIMTLIDAAAFFRIAASTGPGHSLLEGGVNFATGESTTVPLALRRIVAGTNVTIDTTANALTINATPAGVTLLSDGPTPATSLIHDPAGVLRTLAIAAGHGLTISTATAGRITLGLSLTPTGGGINFINNANGQLKTLAVGPGMTTDDTAGLVTLGLATSSLGGGTSILSTTTGAFKSITVAPALTLSTAVANQLQFGLNLTQLGGGASLYSSSAGVLKTIAATGGVVLSDVGNLLSLSMQLTDAGGGATFISNVAGVLKTLAVTPAITLDTTTPNVMRIGLNLTEAGSGATSLISSAAGVLKTLNALGGMTLTESPAGRINVAMNLTNTGGATSILSTTDGVFKTLGADAAVTISTATANQVRFGLNLTEVGGGTSALSSAAGVLRTFGAGAGATVSIVSDRVTYGLNLTELGGGASLISSSAGVLKTLGADAAVTISTATANQVRFGLNLTEVGGGTSALSSAAGILRTFGGSGAITVSVVTNRVTYALNLTSAGVGTSLISAATGVLKSLRGTTQKVSISDDLAGTLTASLPNTVHIGSNNAITSSGNDDGLLVVGSPVVSGSGDKYESILMGSLNLSSAIYRMLVAGNQNTINRFMAGGCMIAEQGATSAGGDMYNPFMIGMKPKLTGSYQTIITGGNGTDATSSFYDGASDLFQFPGGDGLALAGTNVYIGGRQASGETRFYDRVPKCAIAPAVGDDLVNLTYLNSVIPAPPISPTYAMFAAHQNTTLQTYGAAPLNVSYAATLIDVNSCVTVVPATSPTNSQFLPTRTGYYRVHFSVHLLAAGVTATCVLNQFGNVKTTRKRIEVEDVAIVDEIWLVTDITFAFRYAITGTGVTASPPASSYGNMHITYLGPP